MILKYLNKERTLIAELVSDELTILHEIGDVDWGNFSSQSDIENFVEEPIAPPTAEEQLVTMPAVSLTQISAAMAAKGYITKTEARDWVINAVIPAEAKGYIDLIEDEDQRFVAELRAAKPTSVLPTNELVLMFAESRGLGSEDLVDLFNLASSM